MYIYHLVKNIGREFHVVIWHSSYWIAKFKMAKIFAQKNYTCTDAQMLSLVVVGMLQKHALTALVRLFLAAYLPICVH